MVLEQGVLGPEVPVGVEVATVNLVREKREKSEDTLKF